MTHEEKLVITTALIYHAKQAFTNRSMILNIGIIGLRGMVGSVLQERMHQENDLENCQAHYFSCSQAGQVTTIAGQSHTLGDAYDCHSLAKMHIIIATQGSQYTKDTHPKLRANHWQGYWLDAASYLRTAADSTIILDPINQAAIIQAINDGKKDFIGSNCTVSLMLMAIAGLVENHLVKSIQATTYQAISGAGAKAITELHQQIKITGQQAETQNGLDLANTIHDIIKHQPEKYPQQHIHAPLAVSLIPWIDQEKPNGQSKEEWKAMIETNKILQRERNPIPVDSTCVRTPALRCHSQSLFIELTKNIPLETIETYLSQAHPWLKIIPNTKEASMAKLNPIQCSNQLDILVGRLRKANLGENYIQLFTIGDQLLWGAAEPIRRVLVKIIQHLQKNAHPKKHIANTTAA